MADGDWGPIIAALDRNTAAQEGTAERLFALRSEVHATNRRSVWQVAMLALQLLSTAALILVLTLTMTTLNRIVTVTSPAAQAKQAQVLATAIHQIEHCVINHDDHLHGGVALDPACPSG